MSDPARLNSVPKMMLSATTIVQFDIAPSSRSGGFLFSQQSTNARATIPAKIPALDPSCVTPMAQLKHK